MTRKRLLSSVVFFIVCLLVTGQRFSYITPRDGLSQTSVKAISQDYRGFLWFGTADGLNKYDGYGFKVYKNDPDIYHTISGNDISCIYENPYDSSLWIGTQDAGINFYDRKLDRFLHPASSEMPDIQYITDIVAVSNDIMLVATDRSGIFRAQRNDTLISMEPLLGNDCLRGSVDCFECGEDGSVWIGTEGGLYRWSREAIGRGEAPVEVTNDITRSYEVSAIEFDRKGYLWIGTWSGGGLLRYNQINGSFTHFLPGTAMYSLPSGSIRDILETDDGRIMIATMNGLAQYLPEKSGFRSYGYSALPEGLLSDNDVYTLLEDKSGILWIGTSMGGVNKLDKIYDRFFLFSNFISSVKVKSGRTTSSR